MMGTRLTAYLDCDSLMVCTTAAGSQAVISRRGTTYRRGSFWDERPVGGGGRRERYREHLASGEQRTKHAKIRAKIPKYQIYL